MKMTTKVMMMLCTNFVIVVLLSQAGYAGLDGTAFTVALIAGCALVIAMGSLLNRGIAGIIDKTYWYQRILDAIPFLISVTDMNKNWTFMNVKRGGRVCRPDQQGQHTTHV